MLLAVCYGFHAEVNLEISNVQLTNKKSHGGKIVSMVSFDVENKTSKTISEPVDILMRIDNGLTQKIEVQFNLKANSSSSHVLTLDKLFPEETFHLRIHAESKDQSYKSNTLDRMVTFSDGKFYFTHLNFGWEIPDKQEESLLFNAGDEASDLIVYNFLTPNNDGKNDVLMIENIPKNATSTLTIYSLDGEIIFQEKNYQNTWAGTLDSGEKVPQGQVVYSLEIDGVIQKKGYITIDY